MCYKHVVTETTLNLSRGSEFKEQFECFAKLVSSVLNCYTLTCDVQFWAKSHKPVIFGLNHCCQASVHVVARRLSYKTARQVTRKRRSLYSTTQRRPQATRRRRTATLKTKTPKRHGIFHKSGCELLCDIFLSITTAITQSRPSDVDLRKRPFRDSGALACYPILNFRWKAIRK